ncbi:MAG: ATP phosphoribosyltransferase regulatory subunit, partial [Firmicutes bacterium]|nr:ATP phosphoribosyltransferase regulatory subunit [Bacillota bacterium]
MEQLPDLTPEERIPLLLRSIYESYGYRRYSMGRFEPYDVYWQNRNFLKSEQVLTFSNFDGKLMALRPDVTVSIAKNIAADAVAAKLYYIENVFRQRQGSREYSEISQIGLENIGSDDVYSDAETLLLALKSLELLGADYLLCLSHMGVISAVMDWCGLQDQRADEMLELLRQKNAGGMQKLAAAAGLDPDQSALLITLARVSGEPQAVL